MDINKNNENKNNENKNNENKNNNILKYYMCDKIVITIFFSCIIFLSIIILVKFY